jgi:hypothetical protein
MNETWDPTSAFFDGVFAATEELDLRTLHFTEADLPAADATPEEVEACVERAVRRSIEHGQAIAQVTPLIDD